MMRELMKTLAGEPLGLREAFQFNGRLYEWLTRHLGWDETQLGAHFEGLAGHLAGAVRLTEAWYPGCLWMVAREADGRGSATLVVRGFGAPVVARAPDPANALLLACFEVHDLRIKREAARDMADGLLVVAA